MGCSCRKLRELVGPEVSAKVDAVDEIEWAATGRSSTSVLLISGQGDGEDHTVSGINGERSTRQKEGQSAISRDQYDAVLLDLDGVITDTASVHAACWKQMFDEYLRKCSRRSKNPSQKRPGGPVAPE